MNKKKIIIIGAIAVAVAGLLVAAYLTKTKEPAEDADEPDISHITAEADSGVAGPALDALPEDVWDSGETGYNGFTTRAQLGDVADSIGVLTIDKIDMSCQVYDSDADTVMEDMKKGAAHYKSTSYWDGNIGFSAHNGNASYCYFDQLHKLKEGDVITYETTLGTRSYAVQTISRISEEDWSMLERTDDNRVTLTTCINGQETQRLCVQAVEVAS